jgi:hypothetical protein
MEQAVVLCCYYSLFCFICFREEEKPVSSTEPKVTVNPTSKIGPKGET